MINRIKTYKSIIVVLAVIIIISLLILTVDAINETENWQYFNLDFESKDHIISSYGSLIGGILAFLAILFVIFQIQEERQFFYQERLTEKENERKRLLGRLKMLSSLIKTIVIEIEEQGKVMIQFADDETKKPSKMNMMSFRSLNNFRRIINMDELTNYQAFEMYFPAQEWEKYFINLNNTIDFYHDNLDEMINKFNSQINEKVKKQKSINDSYNKLIEDCSNLIESYHQNFSLADYLNQDWSSLVNGFVHSHHTYLKNCEDNDRPINLREISNTLLLPFIKGGILLRDSVGFDEYGSHSLISLSSKIRKEINAMEMHCKYYAENVRQYYSDYYVSDNKTLTSLITIQNELTKIIKKDSKI